MTQLDVAHADAVLLRHLEDYKRYVAAQDALNDGADADAAYEAEVAAWGRRVGGKIASLKATTVDGLLAQMWVISVGLRWGGTTAAERAQAEGSVCGRSNGNLQRG